MPDQDEIQGLDIEAAATQIGDDLFGVPEEEQPNGPVNDAIVTAPETPEAEAAEVVARPAPSSWAKETHELWTKLPAEAQAQIEHREKQMLEGLSQYKEHQDFGRAMRDVTAPYKALLNSQGVDEVKAVQYFLDANYKLSQGSPEQKLAHLQKIAAAYGLSIGPQEQQQQVDPALRTLEEKVNHLTSTLTERQQAQYRETVKQTTSTVNQFASEKDASGNLKRPYFDEVADDIVGFIQLGADLESAYDKAVYANPTTRAKEVARLQKEHEANLRNKSKVEAEAARKASSTNVRGRDTRRSPTEAMGTMEDTMKETLSAIKSRAH